MSLVDYGDSGSESEENEPVVSTAAPRPSTQGSGLLSSLPAAKFGSGIALPPAKGKARIALPTAPDSDSDDDCMPPQKRLSIPIKGGQGSGLMALLPQPKNTFQKAKLNVPVATSGASTPSLATLDASRAANPNMPSEKKAGRSLMPHTLTKKKTDPPPAVNTKVKPANAKGSASSSNSKDTTEEEEDDANDGSFFSFEAPSVSKMLLAKAGAVENSAISTTRNDAGGNSGSDTDSYTAANATVDNYTVASATTYSPTDRSILQPQVAEPATSDYVAYADATYAPACADAAYAPAYGDVTYGPASGPLLETGSSWSSVVHEETPRSAPSSDLQSLLSSEDFQRLGRGGKRGRKDLAAELNNIVDFDENKRAASYNNLPQKFLTEEKGVRMPKGQQPSRSMKSKHQITYLAFQAKERELELKNQWSQNRLTKRQTQAKYGF